MGPWGGTGDLQHETVVAVYLQAEKQVEPCYCKRARHLEASAFMSSVLETLNCLSFWILEQLSF